MVKRPVIHVLFCGFLAACGGGSGESPAPGVGGATANNQAPAAASPNPSSPGAPVAPAAPTVVGSTPSSPAPQEPTTQLPFTARVTVAPDDGATISGMVPLQIHGTRIAHAELLPPDGYAPRHGVFQVLAEGTTAILPLDTRRMPNGEIMVRIAAFDKPAGQPGAIEITAMPPRRWIIRNGVIPATRTDLSESDPGCNNSIQAFADRYPSLLENAENRVESLTETASSRYLWRTFGAAVVFTWPRALGATSCTMTYTQAEPQTGFAPLFPDLL